MEIWERTYNYIQIGMYNNIPVYKRPYGYIYCIWNSLLNLPIYVGQSKYKQSHGKTKTKFKNYFGSGLLISRYIKKFGKDNLYKEVCDFANNQVELNQLEREIIKYYNTLNKNNIYGLNIDIGGNFPTQNKGWHHSEEAKLKIAKASKERWKDPIYKKIVSDKIKNGENSGKWKKGHATWNKGLTKENCPKLARITETKLKNKKGV